MPIKVTLRSKPISKGRRSLYLDFYPAIPHPKTGVETRREFLSLYIIDKPKNPFDKTANKENKAIAESIRQQRANWLNKPEIYSEFEKQKLKAKELGEKDFVEYFKKLCDNRKGSNFDNWTSCLNYIKDYTQGALKFNEIDIPFLEGFKKRLLEGPSLRSKKKTLAKNSAKSYFDKVKAALKQAYKEGFLSVDINQMINGIKPQETIREFLNIEELNRLVTANCKSEPLKKAALFSAVTGLRHIDIISLTWSQIRFDKSHGYSIAFRQSKSEGVEYHPISQQAYDMIGEQKGSTENVFHGLNYSASYKEIITNWLKDADIDKEITFHNFRHTYATLTLQAGSSLYTVSKMLGHKNISTTQIYAKVVDAMKREAANKIELEL